MPSAARLPSLCPSSGICSPHHASCWARSDPSPGSLACFRSLPGPHSSPHPLAPGLQKAFKSPGPGLWTPVDRQSCQVHSSTPGAAVCCGRSVRVWEEGGVTVKEQMPGMPGLQMGRPRASRSSQEVSPAWGLLQGWEGCRAPPDLLLPAAHRGSAVFIAGLCTWPLCRPQGRATCWGRAGLWPLIIPQGALLSSSPLCGDSE